MRLLVDENWLWLANGVANHSLSFQRRCFKVQKFAEGVDVLQKGEQRR
jgi:hypothetical protein